MSSPTTPGGTAALPLQYDWLSFDAETRTFTGNPLDEHEGSYEIWVFVSDRSVESSAFFTLTVELDTNKPPVAADDTATVDEGGSVDITASTLLANDTDSDNATLTVSAVGSAVNGTASLSTDKTTVTYVHDGSETTTDSFTYTVSDGAATDTGTVTVTVTPVNDAPVASDDTATVAEGGTVEVTASTLLTNDTDAENATLSVSAVDGAVNGAVSLSTDKTTATYVHDGSETTTGSFTYTISDGAATDTATVTITVTPANDAPVAPSIPAQTAAEAMAFTYQAPAFTDPESDSLTYTAALSDGSALPAWLSFSAANRTFTGTPLEADTPANLTIRVTATDDGTPSLSSSASFTLTVTAVNDAPVAVDDTATVAEGGTLEVTASTLIANDTDAENATLSVTAVGGAVNGSVSLSTDKTTATYVHDGSETTTGSFTYTVSDGAATDTGTVTVTVTPVNDAPIAPSVPDQSATEATAFSYQAPAFTDPEDDSLTYTAALSDGSALPAWLSFTAATRTFTGTPLEADTPANLIIRVTATDDGTPPASSSTTFTLTVPETNNRPPQPQVSDQAASVDQSFTYTVPEVTDPDGDSLTYNAVQGEASNPLPDWLSFDDDSRTFSGTPGTADVGEYIIVVSVEDQTFTAKASFVITVAVAANQAPVAPTLAAQTATEDQAFSFTPPAFTDPDDDTLTYSASLSDGTALPTWLFFDAATRSFTGTPRENDTPEALTVRVTATDDGTPPASSSATFTLTVAEVNGRTHSQRRAQRDRRRRRHRHPRRLPQRRP